MKKVVYSVTRYRREDIDKMSGLGYITDTDLVIACVSKAGKPYIRIFEDCVKDCHPIPDKPDEYKGAYSYSSHTLKTTLPTFSPRSNIACAASASVMGRTL